MSTISMPEEITELLRYILFSDYIELDLSRKETAISAIIIANIESGKTSLIEQFAPNTGILHITDLTAWGIQHKYINELKIGQIKRIIIPDMINPLNRKQETVSGLITFLNAYISWEGVRTIMTYALQIEIKIPIRGSILTTIAIKDYKKLNKGLAAVGFLSRMMPITYSYDSETVSNILLEVAQETDGWRDINLAFPSSPVNINMESGLSVELIDRARKIGEQAGAYGFRAMKQLRVLTKCVALSDGREEVRKDDIDRVLYLTGKYIGYPVTKRTKKDGG